MPRARKYCADPDCMELVPGHVRNCEQHKSRWPTDGRTQRTKDPLHEAWAVHVMVNADYRCQIRYQGICTGDADHADHIKPVAEGGLPYDPGNGQASCASCHRAKSSDEGHRARGHRVAERTRMP